MLMTNMTIAEQLTALFLQMKAFNPAFNKGAAVPLQLQLNTNTSLTSEDCVSKPWPKRSIQLWLAKSKKNALLHLT